MQFNMMLSFCQAVKSWLLTLGVQYSTDLSQCNPLNSSHLSLLPKRFKAEKKFICLLNNFREIKLYKTRYSLYYRYSPSRTKIDSLLKLLHHTQPDTHTHTHTLKHTSGKTPLNEWQARRTDCFLNNINAITEQSQNCNWDRTAYNIHKTVPTNVM
jgi:hypothetical protein